MSAYLSVLGYHLGAPVPIVDLPDPGVVRHLSGLLDEGLACCRVSDLSTMQLAAAVTPGAPGGPGPVDDVDTVIVCTDSADQPDATRWLVDYQSLAGLGSTRSVLLTGSGCANAIAAVEMSEGLLALGRARRVLGVTADRTVRSDRYRSAGQTVLSDSAASWLVTARPDPGSFEILAVASETRCVAAPGAFGDARTIIRAIAAAYGRVQTALTEPPRYVVTPHLGRSSCELLTQAAGFPGDRRYAGLTAGTGHCFAADPLLDLVRMRDDDALDGGDTVLVVISAPHTWWLAALRFIA